MGNIDPLWSKVIGRSKYDTKKLGQPKMRSLDFNFKLKDARDHAIRGAAVMFKVRFKGEEKVLGPIQTQGIKDRPVSIQIPSQIDDPVIEVTASYEGRDKTVLVDTRQTVNMIIKLEWSGRRASAWT